MNSLKDWKYITQISKLDCKSIRIDIADTVVDTKFESRQKKWPPEKWSTEEKILLDKTNEFIFCQCLSSKI